MPVIIGITVTVKVEVSIDKDLCILVLYQREPCCYGSVWGKTREEAVIYLSPVRRRGATTIQRRNERIRSPVAWQRLSHDGSSSIGSSIVNAIPIFRPPKPRFIDGIVCHLLRITAVGGHQPDFAVGNIGDLRTIRRPSRTSTIPSLRQVHGDAPIGIHNPHIAVPIAVGDKRDLAVGLPPASDSQSQGCQADDSIEDR